MQGDYNDQTLQLPIIVVEGSGPALLGRNWLHELRLDWPRIFSVQLDTQHPPELAAILDKYPAVFKDELGGLRGAQAKIHVLPGVQPNFRKPHTVPYALKPAVERELIRLQREGIIEPVKFSEWAAPIVAVVKPDGHVHICGDYRLTVWKLTPSKESKNCLPVCRGRLLHEARSQACLPTAGPGRRVKKVHNHQHTPRVIEVQQATIRHLLCPSHFPEDYGQSAPGCATCSRVPGRHFDNWQRHPGTPAERGGPQIEAQQVRVPDPRGGLPWPQDNKRGDRWEGEGIPNTRRSFQECLVTTASFSQIMSATLAPLYALLQKDTNWE